MKISLRKIGKTPSDFEVKSDKMTFKGYLEYHSGKLILLKGHLEGTLPCECYLCAKDFDLPVDEAIEFFISDGLYKDEDGSMIDIIEAVDGQVDLDELLRSEIELLKSGYNACEECSDSEDFEYIDDDDSIE